MCPPTKASGSSFLSEFFKASTVALVVVGAAIVYTVVMAVVHWILANLALLILGGVGVLAGAAGIVYLLHRFCTLLYWRPPTVPAQRVTATRVNALGQSQPAITAGQPAIEGRVYAPNALPASAVAQRCPHARPAHDGRRLARQGH